MNSATQKYHNKPIRVHGCLFDIHITAQPLTVTLAPRALGDSVDNYIDEQSYQYTHGNTVFKLAVRKAKEIFSEVQQSEEVDIEV